ncbi:hypothetical protein [Apibacter adventoris]|nr:hypothetical protein [Apibacter adventoris]
MDKSRLSIKDRLTLNKLEKEYRLNSNCEFIDIVNGTYSIYFENFSNDLKNTFNIKNLDNTVVKSKIKSWEITEILKVTHNYDIIVISDEYFKVKVKLINTELFFLNFIDKKISNHIGLDISYYNENKKFTNVFYDEEYEIQNYLKKWN